MGKGGIGKEGTNYPLNSSDSLERFDLIGEVSAQLHSCISQFLVFRALEMSGLKSHTQQASNLPRGTFGYIQKLQVLFARRSLKSFCYLQELRCLPVGVGPPVRNPR